MADLPVDHGAGQAPVRAARGATARVLGAAGLAAVLLAGFLLTAQVTAGHDSTAATGTPAGPAAAAATDTGGPLPPGTLRSGGGPGYVVRSAPNLIAPGDAAAVAERLRAHGARRAWVQLKQDETEEHPSGTLFYPSRLAPVAPGFTDGRLAGLVTALADRGVAPIGWLPVLHDARAAAANPGWRAQRATEDGRLETDPEWLCPFRPEVRAHQAAIAADAVRAVPGLRGLYLDFIRYDDDFGCADPASLAALDARAGWSRRTGAAPTPADLRRAAKPAAGREFSQLWSAWTALRAEQIAATVTEIRAAVHAVRPGLPVGAFVLPFSAKGYAANTAAGQDLARLAGTGLSELVLMTYWDDWGHDPAWVRRSVDDAARTVAGRVPLGVVLDGDMGVRSTRLTLETLGPWLPDVAWFRFDGWAEPELALLARAVDGHRREGPMPAPDRVSVVIRIDTEPDDQPSYDAVHPEMIDALLELFAEEDVPASFLTVGRLAERQPDAIRRAAAAGHEIGSHAYDHEQIDALDVPAQLVAVDRGLDSLRRLGFDVHGFGAPRNSITDEARDRLIAHDLEYDGSAAYDPMTGLIDVRYAERTDPAGPGADRIVVVPFVIPNDWDARVVQGLDAEAMAQAWIQRLDRVVHTTKEPVFVLDIHQWSASQPDNLAALRRFIRAAKACDRCRIETLRQAAAHARTVLDRYEPAAVTSGVRSPATPRPATNGASR